MQNDDVNNSNIMDMMHDEAMMEQMAAAKNFPRKIMNNIDVANLLKQVQAGAAVQLQHQQQQLKMSSPASSAHSISPRSLSPNVLHTTTQHMLGAPVVPSTSSATDPSN